jgi:hypothetical protein
MAIGKLKAFLIIFGIPILMVIVIILASLFFSYGRNIEYLEFAFSAVMTVVWFLINRREARIRAERTRPV